jgi:hypothetical protein
MASGRMQSGVRRIPKIGWIETLRQLAAGLTKMVRAGLGIG